MALRRALRKVGYAIADRFSRKPVRKENKGGPTPAQYLSKGTYAPQGKRWPQKWSPFFKETLKEGEVIHRSPAGFAAFNGPTAYLRLLVTDTRRFDDRPYAKEIGLTKTNRGRTMEMEQYAETLARRVKEFGFKISYVGYTVETARTQPQAHLHVAFNPFLDQKTRSSFEALVSHPAGFRVLREEYGSRLSNMSLLFRPILSGVSGKIASAHAEKLTAESKKIAQDFRQFIASPAIEARLAAAQSELQAQSPRFGGWDGTGIAELHSGVNIGFRNKPKGLAVGKKFIGRKHIVYARDDLTDYSWDTALTEARKFIGIRPFHSRR